MFSHALLISAYISYSIFNSSLLISVPSSDIAPNIRQTAFERNLKFFYQDFDIEKDPNLIAPYIEASAALALDLNSGAVLYKKSAHERLQIASITKLMTVLLALENGNLDDVATVSTRASEIEGSKAWLFPGDKLTIRDLIKASLIGSANDAAYALAEHFGGTLDKFVDMMNKKVLELGLGSTHFDNAVGFDDEENYSTAFEVSVLARELLDNSFFRETVRVKEEIIYSVGGSDYKLESTNDLLDSYLNIYGIKTGTTVGAGESLVAIGKIDNGREIMVVVLNSPDRFKETKIIFDWVGRAFMWK